MCKDFLLILPSNALDRCINKDDVYLGEIKRALEKGKNIIPIMLNGFTWTEDFSKISELELLKTIADKNGIETTSPNLPETLIRLQKEFLTTKRHSKWSVKKRVCIGSIVIAIAFIVMAIGRFL